MSNIKYNLVTVGDEANLTAFIDGEMYTASSEHPNFKAIVAGVVSDDPDVVDLFDVAKAINARFERLSERVTLVGGEVCFDGDPVHNSLTAQVVRFLDEGVDDWEPLVYFLENIMENPSANSRKELFDWIGNDESLTITDDGWLVGYKGCRKGNDGVPVSTRNAPASEQVRVNDELIADRPVPNPVGATVSMPRSLVDDNLNRHCSNGLHIGTFRYANSFQGPAQGGVVLEVHVHPRDVVAVTSDSNREKIRAASYQVVGPVEKQHTAPLIKNTQVRVDTRQNHTRQERYPKGHPKAGQFKPKA